MTSDLPTASEILQEYFGETDSFKCVQVWNARRAQTRSFLEEVSDLAIDTSLFPYQAQGPFETPIPTLDEIAAAWALAEKRPGFTPHIEEAENLLYLERHSDVRTPKVYAAFSSQDADTFNLRKEGDKTRLVYYYLIEEYIEGELLSDVGRELEKPPLVRKIGKLLGEQLQRLRNVPAEDPNHFGRVGGKPYLAISPYYHPPAPDFHDYGPFNYGERRLYAVDKDNLPRRQKDFDGPRGTGRPPPRTVPSGYSTSQHYRKLVRNEGKIVDVEEVILIDWAFMSWMPSWYEAADLFRDIYSPVDFYSTIGREVFEGEMTLYACVPYPSCRTFRVRRRRPSDDDQEMVQT
ncbi:hypothetical protein BDV95DRAFT_596087 [Massariosphaeria phaeospora]|uniref:Aminoglycoside phosphotransferase domain-containing protein n=1 Tax=Massariosphaeria phaeospora TaxID=100035 RepID=A0A7C8I3B3_9PLEO|nr:hypothetical protein BDV95DRAFT_596087 [Massariosphaeria phaeospora]